MSKRFHIAIGVTDIAASVADYTQRLGDPPVQMIDNQYALFRTDTLNVSIRKSDTVSLRHLGWESDTETSFTTQTDCNGITWEYFAQQHQDDEINETWPSK